MKALVCVEHGGPEKLVIEDLPTPEPGKGEVRIRMKAAGVNFPDVLIIQNLYQFKPPLPFSPGGEAAGIVEAVGEGVRRFKPGDRVIAMVGDGAFREQFLAREDQLSAIADDMPFDVAAGFVMTYGTSHHALKQRARLQPGESLLVLGASGGVGLAAVDLGRRMGASQVIAAASSAEKLALCREYGATDTVNYTSEDLKARVKELTGGKGVDVIYDPVGDRYADPAFRTIAWNGRYLVVGFAGGEIPKLALNLPLIKGASIIGVFWGAFTQYEPELHRENMQEIFDWFTKGELKPHISARFPLHEGAEAIRMLMDRKAKGKVIITA